MLNYVLKRENEKNLLLKLKIQLEAMGWWVATMQ
jgi:hypothetical protein